ncbi:MAG: hypothetical protein K0U98_17015 [Deltaproteobacteria bacterium]|nr:hypothetical protein [Deltaproteobacteria bacterium]
MSSLHWKRPLPWLAVLCVWRFVSFHQGQLLVPVKAADTQGYLKLARADSLVEILSAIRTYGYALFLKIPGYFLSSVDWVPTAHLLIYLGAVLLFWKAVAEFTDRPWLAFAGTLPLFFAPILQLVPRLQADSLAATMGCVTSACLLLLARRPRSYLLWAALGGATFLTYQIRPAYLFLLVLVPLMGVVARLCLEPLGGRDLRRWTTALVALCFVPWLAFCTLRWVAVDHFGLVSFGGINMIGLAASFLTPELVEELPEAQRPFAGRILAEREKKKLEPLEASSITEKWYRQYNINVWQIAVQVLREPGDKRDGRLVATEFNGVLTKLCKEILRRRPGLYFKWIVDSFAFGVGEAMARPLIVWLGVLLGISAPLSLLRRRRDVGGGVGIAFEGRGDRARWFPVFGLALLSFVYFCGSLALVALVEVPIARYVDAIILLIPSALAVTLFQLWVPNGETQL